MVATRNHPVDFQEEPGQDTPIKQQSPTKRATRASTAANASPTKAAQSSQQISTQSRAAGKQRSEWTHTPSNLTLIWLAVSLPLVVWDTGYVLLRPHSMPGGKLHWPIWSPYKLYGEVDKNYGFEAIETNNGWTAAQGTGNVVETLAYFVYLYLVYAYGEQEPVQGRGAPDRNTMGGLRGLSESRTLSGSVAAYATLLAFTAATMTVWKTILYWLIEVFNGFASIGHNGFFNLIFVFVIPNIAWIIVPSYIMYILASEIVQGLETASGEGKKFR